MNEGREPAMAIVLRGSWVAGACRFRRELRAILAPTSAGGRLVALRKIARGAGSNVRASMSVVVAMTPWVTLAEKGWRGERLPFCVLVR